jgi:UDP-glucuronate 4-epimerase
VTGLDNFNDYYDPAIKRANLARATQHPQFTLLESDICDEPTVSVAFDACRPDVVVHLAARAGVRPSLADPNLYHRVNVIGTQHILDAARVRKLSHLVIASSSSVYGGLTTVPFTETMDISRPISPYAATKRMNELMGHVYSHVYGLNVTLLRFFTAYGPRQRPDMAIHKFVKAVDRGDPVPMFGEGTTRRDYTYIDDIIDGVIRSVDTPFPFEIFNLGEQRTTTLRDLIGIVERHVGKPARIDPKPMQPGDVEITYADIAKARDLLGYSPRFSLDEGVRRFVEWYRASR